MILARTVHTQIADIFVLCLPIVKRKENWRCLNKSKLPSMLLSQMLNESEDFIARVTKLVTFLKMFAFAREPTELVKIVLPHFEELIVIFDPPMQDDYVTNLICILFTSLAWIVCDCNVKMLKNRKLRYLMRKWRDCAQINGLECAGLTDLYAKMCDAILNKKVPPTAHITRKNMLPLTCGQVFLKLHVCWSEACLKTDDDAQM